MEPKPIVLYFGENQRQGQHPNGSKLIAHLVQAPPATAMVVFPHRDFLEIMDQPGWYLVRISFPPNGRTAIATPVTDKTILECIRDLADVGIVG